LRQQIYEGLVKVCVWCIGSSNPAPQLVPFRVLGGPQGDQAAQAAIVKLQL